MKWDGLMLMEADSEVLYEDNKLNEDPQVRLIPNHFNFKCIYSLIRDKIRTPDDLNCAML